MRRSIQIVSACAFFVAAAGPLTGFSDGLAAEGDTLPCNSFCRTWMGNAGGEAAAPQPAPAETVTVKPAEVSRDPEQITEDPAPTSVDAGTASEIDRGGKPYRPKQKRRARPDTSDIADQRSPGGRSKASKLAKGSKPEIDAADSQGFEPSPRRQAQAEDGIRKASRDRDANPAVATRVTAREVPLPPRLPRAGRPVRTGVAKAGSNTGDEIRAGGGAGLPARAPDALQQADVPHPAKGAVATAVSKPTPKIDPAAKGVVGDGVAAIPAPLKGRNATPAVDARQETSPAVSPNDDPHRVAPENAVANAKPSPDPATVTPAAGLQTSAARVVVPQSSEEPTAGTGQQTVRPSAAAATGGAAPKLPNTVVEAPPVTVERPVVAMSPPPSETRTAAPLPNPDKSEPTIAAASPASMAGAAAPKDATTAPPLGAATAGQTAVPPLPDSRTVRPASEPDQPVAGVALQDAAPPATVVTGEMAAERAPPAPSQSVAVVGTEAAPSFSAGRIVGAASEPDMRAPGAASQAAVPPGAVTTGVAAAKDAPTTPSLGAAVVGTTAIPPSAESRAVEAASEPDAVAAGNASHAAGPPPPLATAPTDAPRPLALTRTDGATQPIAASPEPPMPAVPALPVPGPGEASARGSAAPMTAMNEAEPPTSSQSPPASPEAAHATSVDRGEAERLAASPSRPTKPSGSGYGTLGRIDNTLRPPPGETASLVMPLPPAPAPADENPANLVKIAIGDVSTKPEGTAIAYTITNTAAAPVDLLFIRCNAVDRKGIVVGSAFDYVENIPAGQQVQRTVRMSSEITGSGQTFSCANDAATQ